MKGRADTVPPLGGVRAGQECARRCAVCAIGRRCHRGIREGISESRHCLPWRDAHAAEASAAMGWDLDVCQGEIRRTLVSVCSPDPLLVPSRSVSVDKSGIVHREQPRSGRASPAAAVRPRWCAPWCELVHHQAHGEGGRADKTRCPASGLPGLSDQAFYEHSLPRLRPREQQFFFLFRATRATRATQ